MINKKKSGEKVKFKLEFCFFLYDRVEFILKNTCLSLFLRDILFFSSFLFKHLKFLNRNRSRIKRERAISN